MYLFGFCRLSPLCHSCATVVLFIMQNPWGLDSQEKSTPIIHAKFQQMNANDQNTPHTQTECIHEWKHQLAHLNDHVQPCTHACSGKNKKTSSHSFANVSHGFVLTLAFLFTDKQCNGYLELFLEYCHTQCSVAPFRFPFILILQPCAKN